MTILLWSSFIAACIISFMVWIANLNTAASSTDDQSGLIWVRWSWGIFLALILLNLMMNR